MRLKSYVTGDALRHINALPPGNNCYLLPLDLDILLALFSRTCGQKSAFQLANFFKFGVVLY
jgi:hypothetical protein